jgi:hypothetical protein
MSDGSIVQGTDAPPSGDDSEDSGDNTSSSTSAMLGKAILGTMLLGT